MGLFQACFDHFKEVEIHKNMMGLVVRVGLFCIKAGLLLLFYSLYNSPLVLQNVDIAFCPLNKCMLDGTLCVCVDLIAFITYHCMFDHEFMCILCVLQSLYV